MEKKELENIIRKLLKESSNEHPLFIVTGGEQKKEIHVASKNEISDIYIEYAPGLYRNPMTVPMEVVEIMDDGNNTGPVVNSVRRKNNIHGPEETKAKSDIDASVNLTTQNVKLPGANKWDDTQPGGGNYKPKLR